MFQARLYGVRLPCFVRHDPQPAWLGMKHDREGRRIVTYYASSGSEQSPGVMENLRQQQLCVCVCNTWSGRVK